MPNDDARMTNTMHTNFHPCIRTLFAALLVSAWVAAGAAAQDTDADERAYGEELSGLLGDAHYIIDSGRNGNGATDEWCNPPDRAYGTPPAAASEGGAEHLDAYVWVKPAGESDGECNGGPPAGDFWPARALEMAASSGW